MSEDDDPLAHLFLQDFAENQNINVGYVVDRYSELDDGLMVKNDEKKEEQTPVVQVESEEIVEYIDPDILLEDGAEDIAINLLRQVPASHIRHSDEKGQQSIIMEPIPEKTTTLPIVLNKPLLDLDSQVAARVSKRTRSESIKSTESSKIPNDERTRTYRAKREQQEIKLAEWAIKSAALLGHIRSNSDLMTMFEDTGGADLLDDAAAAYDGVILAIPSTVDKAEGVNPALSTVKDLSLVRTRMQGLMGGQGSSE